MRASGCGAWLGVGLEGSRVGRPQPTQGDEPGGEERGRGALVQPAPPCPISTAPRAPLCGQNGEMAELPVMTQVNLTSLFSDTAWDLSVVSNSGWVSSVS